MSKVPSDPDCIFCKIVAGQVPCHQLLEDDRILAFLDVGPLARGHALVIPKGHFATIDEVPDGVAAACLRVVPRLSRAINAVVGAKAWNVLQNNGRLANQAVNHVHVHIIPKFDDGGLKITWPAGKLDPEEGRALAQAITAAL